MKAGFMKKIIQHSLIACTLLMTSHAKAESIFGEFQRLPETIEKGITLGSDFGVLILSGDAVNKGQPGKTVTNPGFQVSFNLGYDIVKYLSIESISTIGISQADTNDPVLTGGVNLFLFDIGAKLQLPFDRWNPFFIVGPGLTYSSPEFIKNENWKINILFAAGIEYYTYLRHFSLYAKGSFFYIKDLPINAITTSAGIKYTF